MDAGSEKGAIDCEEKELIQNVFEFNDISVEEICTHRTDVSMLWMDESIDEWEEIIHESRHSYFPVCGEDVDDIIGILDAKDYFRLKEKNHEIIMREAIKPAYFVPENVKASTLFQNMKKSGNYFAVVLDEYGGMEGIITVRDLIEELVGDLSRNRKRIASRRLNRFPTTPGRFWEPPSWTMWRMLWTWSCRLTSMIRLAVIFSESLERFRTTEASLRWKRRI